MLIYQPATLPNFARIPGGYCPIGWNSPVFTNLLKGLGCMPNCGSIPNLADFDINSQSCRFQSLSDLRLVSSIQLLFSILPWSGYTCAFSYLEPITKFANYLSSGWLATSHIEQQLEVFAAKITRETPLSPFKIVLPVFLNKIVQIHRCAEDYNSEHAGIRHIWAIGEELASDAHHRTTLCGIFNVDNSHWVTVIVDTKEHCILYGDSLGGWNCEVLDALQWWIEFHVHGKFKHRQLMIGQQTDGMSCALFAVNVVHFVSPSCPLISQADVVTQRLQWFIDACTYDLNTVSQSGPFLHSTDKLCCSAVFKFLMMLSLILKGIPLYPRSIESTTFV